MLLSLLLFCAVIFNSRFNYNSWDIVETNILKELNMEELIYQENLKVLNKIVGSLYLTPKTFAYLENIIKKLDRNKGKVYLEYFPSAFRKNKSFIYSKYLLLLRQVPIEEKDRILQESRSLIEKQAVSAYTDAFNQKYSINDKVNFHNQILYLILLGDLFIGVFVLFIKK